MSKLILASASPQRKAILEQLGVEFEVRPTHVLEESEGEASEVALVNARRKALAVSSEEGVVLGGDTVVALDHEILCKPVDAVEAREFLKRMCGRRHQVVGAIALARGGEVFAEAVETTGVWFRKFDDAVLEWYLEKNDWQGRAGGYAIQAHGAALVERIEGDYLNIVGLPLARLLDLYPELIRVSS